MIVWTDNETEAPVKVLPMWPLVYLSIGFTAGYLIGTVVGWLRALIF